MERKREAIKHTLKNIQVPFKTEEERLRFEEFLYKKGLSAGRWVRSLIEKEDGERDSPWMSPEDAATYLSVSRSYIYSLISSKEITSYKLKNAVRLHKDDLDNYMRRHARPAIVKF